MSAICRLPVIPLKKNSGWTNLHKTCLKTWEHEWENKVYINHHCPNTERLCGFP